MITFFKERIIRRKIKSKLKIEDEMSFRTFNRLLYFSSYSFFNKKVIDEPEERAN